MPIKGLNGGLGTEILGVERRPNGVEVVVHVMGADYLPGKAGDAVGEFAARRRAIEAAGPVTTAVSSVTQSLSRRQIRGLTTIVGQDKDGLDGTKRDRTYTVLVTR